MADLVDDPVAELQKENESLKAKLGNAYRDLRHAQGLADEVRGRAATLQAKLSRVREASIRQAHYESHETILVRVRAALDNDTPTGGGGG